MNVARILSVVSNCLLAALYLAFSFTISMMYPVFPWYSEDNNYLLFMIVLWLPICGVTIFRLIFTFVAKIYNKYISSLACINALYIPLIFALGYTGIKLVTLRFIGIIALLTMVAYFVLIIFLYKKQKA